MIDDKERAQNPELFKICLFVESIFNVKSCIVIEEVGVFFVVEEVGVFIVVEVIVVDIVDVIFGGKKLQIFVILQLVDLICVKRVGTVDQVVV